jgi:hypothetical protein
LDDVDGLHVEIDNLNDLLVGVLLYKKYRFDNCLYGNDHRFRILIIFHYLVILAIQE